MLISQKQICLQLETYMCANIYTFIFEIMSLGL